MTEALKRAQKRYSLKCRALNLRLRLDKDKDVIDWIDRQDNIAGEIKAMIRERIRSEI